MFTLQDFSEFFEVKIFKCVFIDLKAGYVKADKIPTYVEDVGGLRGYLVRGDEKLLQEK